MAIELPKQKIPAAMQDPKYLIIFGLPKIGKTSLLATLENNLIIDLEAGSDYVDALKVKANTVKDIQEICRAVKEAGCPYKYITLDTVTALEEMVKPLAIQLYRQSPMASERYMEVDDPTRLPNGCGYGFARQALEKVINMVASVTENIIICGHVKDTALKEDMEGSVKDLDLVGKAKRILSAKSDAIGFVHRSENGDLMINFGNNGEVLTGARPKHLAGKDIIVAEKKEDGSFESHWERIYPSLSKSKK